MAERRREDRVEAELEVQYRTAQEFLAAYSKNISGGGIFIRTQQPLTLNRPVVVRFTLPGVDHRFEVQGIVVWTNSTPSRTSFPAGMGIKFLHMKKEDSELIADFINKAKGIAPPPSQKS